MSDMKQIFDLRRNANNAYDKSYTAGEQFTNFISITLKILVLFVLLTLNFLGLSVALNCNLRASPSVKILSAIFGFFFGFVYLLLNYYTYRVLTLQKVCIMNKDRVFPFFVK
jgi:membrane associated rhomboid family serine protease